MEPIKTEKPRRKRDLFSRKNEKLLNRENLVKKVFAFEASFDDSFAKIITEKIKHSGVVYKLMNLRPDNHVHKFLVQRIGDSFNIYFVDDNSASDAEDFIIKLNYDSTSNIVRIFSVYVNDDQIEKELQDSETVKEYIESYLSDVFFRDFQSVLDESYLEKLPDLQKPKGTRFIEPIK